MTLPDFQQVDFRFWCSLRTCRFKENMMDVMAALRKITVDAPVSIGDVVLVNICGADIVATKQIV